MMDEQRKLRLKQEIERLKAEITDEVVSSHAFNRLRSLTSSLKQSPYKLLLTQKDLPAELKRAKTALTKLEKAHGSAPKRRVRGSQKAPFISKEEIKKSVKPRKQTAEK